MATKRPLPSSFSTSNAPTTKRAAPSSTLTAFFPSSTGPARPPQPVVASDPLTDRASTFVAHAAPCTNRVQAATLHAHVRALRTPAHPVECSHEVLAWRCLGLKPGRNGLGRDGEDDWRVEGGAEDDGEKGAGAVVREVLEREGGVDVAIVVSRLYGGALYLSLSAHTEPNSSLTLSSPSPSRLSLPPSSSLPSSPSSAPRPAHSSGIMLGPARFTHIRTVASQALARLGAAQRLATLTAQLVDLDAQIAALSSSSSSSTASAPAAAVPAAVPQAYKALTVDKAERLVAAREKRLGLLRARAGARASERVGAGGGGREGGVGGAGAREGADVAEGEGEEGGGAGAAGEKKEEEEEEGGKATASSRGGSGAAATSAPGE